jgi:hypothetical protein
METLAQFLQVGLSLLGASETCQQLKVLCSWNCDLLSLQSFALSFLAVFL